MNILFSSSFNKQYNKATILIKNAFQLRLYLFMNDHNNSQLHNHPLKGKYKGLKSINITGDWRALYSEKTENGEKIIVFILFGTHSQLYR